MEIKWWYNILEKDYIIRLFHHKENKMESDSDADADPANIFPQIILIVFLTLLNAFFASAELAVLSANKNKIRYLAEHGNKKAKAVENLANDQTKFLSTIQVGITLAGFFSSATAAVGLTDKMGTFLMSINIPYGKDISLVVLTLILSYFTLVFGELFPKRIALKKPEAVAMALAFPIGVIKVITSPFVRLLSASSNILVKITGLESGTEEDKISEDEIISIIENGVNEGIVDSEAQKMIESVFKFNDLEAVDVMTPRVDVYMIDIEDKISEYIDELIKGKYTRIPVYKKYKDNIVGILNIKDILTEAKRVGFSRINILNLLREPYFVTDKIKINTLFKKMQSSKNHIALITDQYGGFRGIVTMEDLVEEIMGNINDEYDDNVQPIIKTDENTYLIDAVTPIQDINRELNLEFEEDNEEYDTLGGLIISLINRIPEEDEDVSIDYQNVNLKIEQMDVNRIEKVILTIHPESSEEDKS
jgi:putative hemolysin